MEILAHLAFALYVLIILIGGLIAVTCSDMVRAMIGLIATLFGVAGMYLLLASPFLAFMQLLIYVGAVSVLVFFAIMLTRADDRGEEGKPVAFGKMLLGVAAAMIPAITLAQIIMTHPPLSIETPTEVPIALLGKGFLEDYMLGFELISLVLTVAMSGAVLLTWRKRDKR